MGVSEELGGYVTLTVAMIIITGILGNVIADKNVRLSADQTLMGSERLPIVIPKNSSI